MLMAMDSTPIIYVAENACVRRPDSLARTDVLLSNVALSAFAGVLRVVVAVACRGDTAPRVASAPFAREAAGIP